MLDTVMQFVKYVLISFLVYHSHFIVWIVDFICMYCIVGVVNFVCVVFALKLGGTKESNSHKPDKAAI
jgi:hypothetical protein